MLERLSPRIVLLLYKKEKCEITTYIFQRDIWIILVLRDAIYDFTSFRPPVIFKGRVAWDFWPLVFFMNRYYLGPKSTSQNIFVLAEIFTKKGFFSYRFPGYYTLRLYNFRVWIPGGCATSGLPYPEVAQFFSTFMAQPFQWPA